ncbi:transporter substrate-binding domain-containing protein [Reinekea marina]|uniref:Transporter substrate-binding domain-containing protein n=1 Tax=Reinekea marina TaxID=1310421 RepID=A0ABV7WT33_9GAMM|nr:transporter substrate-binding domain-containing protein [Reinekea marina]MDN3649017.1 transporter substrate-binding domain-containing protein [Reinekea marina]
MTRKLLLIAFTLIGIAALPSTTFSENGDLPLVNLLTENYGEFNYSLTNRDYEHKAEDIGGTATEIVKKIMADSGIPYRMKLRKWTVSYERALDRPNYGVFSTSRTEAREPLFEWIGPVARYELALFAKKGSNISISSISDLNNLRVGGYQGDAATNILEAQGIAVSTLTNDSLNPRRLHEDLIDVWVSGVKKAYQLSEEAGYPDIEKVFTVRTVDMYLAMNLNSDPIVLQKLRDSFSKLQNSGEINLD